MKLSLPTPLRNALIASFSTLSPLACATSTGTMAIGLVLYTLCQAQTYADLTGTGSAEDPYLVNEATDFTDTNGLFDATNSEGKYYQINYTGAKLSTKTTNAESIEIIRWEFTGTTGFYYTINADITGSGNILTSYSSSNRDIFFNGDLSDWSGSFAGSDNLSTTGVGRLFFQGSGERVAASGTGTIYTNSYITYSTDNSDGSSSTNIANESIYAYQLYIGNTAGVETNAILRSNTTLTSLTQVRASSSLTLAAEYDGDAITLNTVGITVEGNASLTVQEGQSIVSTSSFTLGTSSTATGATLTNAGTFTNTGAINSYYSTITNSGTLSTGTYMSVTSTTITNSGTITTGTGLTATSSTITNTEDGIISLGTNLTLTNTSFDNYGTFNIGSTITLSDTTLTNYGTLNFNLDTTSIVLSLAEEITETTSYQVFVNESGASSNFTDLDIKENFTGLDNSAYRASLQEDGSILLTVNNTVTYDATSDTFELYDQASVGGSTFTNQDNLTLTSASIATQMTVSGATDISTLTLSEGVDLKLALSDADSSLDIYYLSLAENATLRLTDTKLLNWDLSESGFDYTSSSTLSFEGINQSYNVGSDLNDYTGIISITEGNSLTMDKVKEAATLLMEEGATLIIDGSNTYTINFANQGNHSYAGGNLVIESGKVILKYMNKATDLESATFGSITIKDGGTLDWGWTNGSATAADVIVFEGGEFSTFLANTSTFDKFETTNDGGQLRFYTNGYVSGNINFTINTIEGTGTNDVFSIVDETVASTFNITVNIGTLESYNGTLTISGFYVDGSSRVYIQNINNSNGDHTTITGDLYVASASGMNIMGLATIETLHMEEGAQLNISADSQLTLTDTLTLGDASSISNQGSLTFDSSIQIDIADLTWTTENYLTYNYQLITGDGSSNFDSLTIDNLLNSNSDYSYSFDSNGVLSYTLEGTILTEAINTVTTGEEGNFTNNTILIINAADSTTSVGNADETGDISISLLTIAQDSTATLLKDDSFAHALNIDAITLFENAQLTLESTVAGLSSIIASSSSSIHFGGTNQSYDLSKADLSACAGSFTVLASNNLQVAGTLSNSITLTPGDSSESITSLSALADTTLKSKLLISASGISGSAGYVNLDVAEGASLTLSGGVSVSEATNIIKTGDGDLYLSSAGTDTNTATLYVEGGDVYNQNTSHKYNAIYLSNNSTYYVDNSSTGWANFATTFYLNNGTFADISGKTSDAVPDGVTFVIQGGDNYFDMSASTCKITKFEMPTLQGDTTNGTESDGTFTVIGNASVEGQNISFETINNFNGTYIAGGGALFGLIAVTNAEGETTTFQGDFYINQTSTFNTYGDASVSGTLTIRQKTSYENGGTGALVNNGNLTLNNIIFDTSANTLSNAGNLSIKGTVTLTAESQITNNGSLTLGSDVVFDISALDITQTGTYQILSTDSTGNVDLSSLSIANNLTGLNLDIDGVFTRAEFTSTGALDIVVIEGEVVTIDSTEASIALSSTAFTQQDALSFTDLDAAPASASTLTIDVADADLTQIALGSNRDVILSSAESSSVYQVLLGSNAKLTLTDANTSITEILSSDGSSTLTVGTADTSLDYKAGGSLADYTGKIQVNADSSLSLDSSSDYSHMQLGSNSTLSLTKDFADSNVISSEDSTAKIILNGESFTSTATTFDSYTGGIELQSGHLTLANITSGSKIGSISLAAGTELTMNQTTSLSSGSINTTLSIEGGDSAENATQVNITSSFLWHSANASVDSRLTLTSGYVAFDVSSGATADLRGLSLGTEADTTITKTGEGTLIFNLAYTVNTESSIVDINITEGTLQINQAAASGSNGFAFNSITIGTGASLLWSSKNNLSASAVTSTGTIILDGGSYINYYTDTDTSETTTTINAIDVTENGGTFHLDQMKSYEISTLTGDGGTLKITGESDATTGISFSKIVDYDGTISNLLSNENGTVSISEVSTATGITTRLTGDISSAGLTKTGDGQLVIERATVSGNLSLSNAGSITVTDSLTVGNITISALPTLTQTSSTVSDNNVTITSLDGTEASISYEDSTLTNLSISNSMISTEGDLTLNTVELENTSITANNLSLTDVTATDSTIKATDLSIANGLEMSEDGLTYTITALDGFYLDLEGALTLDISMTEEQQGIYDAAIASGSSVSIVIDGLASSMTEEEILSSVDLNLSGNSIDISGLTIENGNVIIQQDVIPEPSTSALSLLALAGLLARRRRQS